MKNIKSFKLWESVKFPSISDLTISRDIQENIIDIGLDMLDEGYKVSYQWWPPYDKYSGSLYASNKYPYINITRNMEKIWYGEIKDFCERIGAYLDTEGYNVVIKYRKENSADYYDVRSTVVDWGPFSNYPMCSSIHYRIEMIDRNIFGDVYESVDSLSKVRYRQIDMDIRDDIRDIFLDLGDDGYDVSYSWVPGFSEDKISPGNYPFVMINKEGLRDQIGRIQNTYDIESFRFSSGILDEYMNRLGYLLGEGWDIYLLFMGNNSLYYLGKPGKVYNSIVYRILMVRR